MNRLNAHVLIIGGGPGGYVCAIRAGQLGLNVVLVEGRALGGTCLNVGCIPSKALIHVADEFAKAKAYTESSILGIGVAGLTFNCSQAMSWKDSLVERLSAGVRGLLKRAKVTVVEGFATLQDGKSCVVKQANGDTMFIGAEHVVLATGSQPVELPSLPFGGRVISSAEALSLSEIPKHLVVVGGGYIGLELGIAFRKLGASVSVVEAAERLMPQYDDALVKPVLGRMEQLGISAYVSARALGLNQNGELSVVLRDGKEIALPADRVLVTIGRSGNFEGSGIANLNLRMRGQFIAIDDQCRTSMRNVWAIGDITGDPMLAHRAMKQGELVAEIIAGKRRAFDNICIPEVCFTDPEIVSVGVSPEGAKELSLEFRSGIFPLSGSGRALATEAEVGFVRVVARAEDNVVLGIQAVGRGVSELAASFGLALEMRARLEDIADTIHAHPTLGEALQEASLKALGRAIHA